MFDFSEQTQICFRFALAFLFTVLLSIVAVQSAGMNTANAAVPITDDTSSGSGGGPAVTDDISTDTGPGSGIISESSGGPDAMDFLIMDIEPRTAFACAASEQGYDRRRLNPAAEVAYRQFLFFKIRANAACQQELCVRKINNRCYAY